MTITMDDVPGALHNRGSSSSSSGSSSGRGSGSGGSGRGVYGVVGDENWQPRATRESFEQGGELEEEGFSFRRRLLEAVKGTWSEGMHVWCMLC